MRDLQIVAMALVIAALVVVAVVGAYVLIAQVRVWWWRRHIQNVIRKKGL